MYRPLLSTLLPLALLLSSLSAQPIHRIWEPPIVQGIAADVEGKLITFEELRREMGPLIPGIRESSRSRQEFERRLEQLYLEVLQNLIDRVLIVREFQDKEFQMPPTIIEDEFDRILIEDFDNDRSQFLDYLKEQGKTTREFRADLLERMIVGAMRSEKRRSTSQISPERIQNFYNENKIHFYQEESVRLRIIMLRPLADESQDLMQQQVERIYRELERGRGFADVARQYSQDSRREQGGDWGWLQRTDLKEELSAAAFSLEPGSYTAEPIELGDQYFILFAEERRDEGIQPLPQVRDRIEDILATQLARQAEDQWLQRLRRQAYIRYY